MAWNSRRPCEEYGAVAESKRMMTINLSTVERPYASTLTPVPSNDNCELPAIPDVARRPVDAATTSVRSVRAMAALGTLTWRTRALRADR